MYGADGSVLHVVGPGEGWTGLSKAYGTSPHRLRELNPWMRQPRPGTAVLVHPGAQHAPAPPAAAAENEHTITTRSTAEARTIANRRRR